MSKALMKKTESLPEEKLYENLTIKLSPAETRLLKAIKSRRVSEYTPDELIINSKILFTGIVDQSGIKSKITDSQLLRLIDILMTYYRFVTLNEIKMAFELAAVGRLDNYLPKDKFGQADSGHYNSMSIEYLSKVLNAYLKFKAEFMINVLSNQKALPAERIEVDYAQLISDRFDQYNATGRLPFMVYSETARYLEQYGLKMITDKELIEGQKRLDDLQELQDAKVEGRMRRVSSLIPSNINTGDSFIAKVSIKVFFDSLIKSGTDIKTLLKNEGSGN